MSKDSLFGLSLFPYLAFLWFITKTPDFPKMARVGFYLTLLFVAITIPAGIYAKVVYRDALANVDWLHGAAEAFLTLANVVVAIGFKQALSEPKSGENALKHKGYDL